MRLDAATPHRSDSYVWLYYCVTDLEHFSLSGPPHTSGYNPGTLLYYCVTDRPTYLEHQEGAHVEGVTPREDSSEECSLQLVELGHMVLHL